jgi:hypothetical protein
MLEEFLRVFESQSEAGLLLCEEQDTQTLFTKLKEREYQEVNNIDGVINALVAGSLAFINLNQTFGKDLYDLLGSISEQVILIQTLDPETLKPKLIPVDRENVKLLIVASSRAINIWQEKFPLSDRVGLIKRYVC